MSIFDSVGLNEDDLTGLIVYQKSIEQFLLDIQQSYRIQRALEEDPGNKLLIGAQTIDDVILRLQGLEVAFNEYKEQKRLAEVEKQKAKL